jgi:MSHA biogenesis protein MshE
MTLKKIRLGDLLVENQLITEEQLQSALKEQKDQGGRLGSTLIDLGYIDEDTLLNTLARQLHVPFVELKNFKLKPEVIQVLPETLARRFKAIPLDKLGDGYLVAMADPTDLFAYDEIARQLKGSIRVAVVKERELVNAIDKIYRRTGDINSLANELAGSISFDGSDDKEVDDIQKAQEDEDAAPVIKLLESIFEDAIQVGASDIHIEPDKDVLRIRLRVDGVLQEQIMQKKSIVAALVLRVKLMSKLNISEKRLPQDGRFSMKIKNRAFDMRVSTMPVQYGESVVMRLLDQSKGLLKLSQIDMQQKIKERMLYHLHRPHGVILITGPTGSGKSTTLYGGLSELNTSERKIITVEDPVEYTIERVSQVQVLSKIGLDFATVLRSCLRQDPDVLMVGEIRDEETAAIALRAALTGHLVLSTLHTNDAISAPTRLINMGVEPYLAASAIRMVLAQRLVRMICSDCKEDYVPTPQEQIWLKALYGQDTSALVFKQGKGCNHCNGTGYKGRIAVHELFEMNQDSAEALRGGDNQRFIAVAKADPNYISLPQCALQYAIEGRTSVQEVFSLIAELEDQDA